MIFTTLEISAVTPIVLCHNSLVPNLDFIRSTERVQLVFNYILVGLQLLSSF